METVGQPTQAPGPCRAGDRMPLDPSEQGNRAAWRNPNVNHAASVFMLCPTKLAMPDSRFLASDMLPSAGPLLLQMPRFPKGTHQQRRLVMPPEALFFEFVMPFLFPPAFGAFVGYCFGRAVRRPGLGAVGGCIGGVTGAWGGIVVYWRSVLPGAPSLGWLATLILAGSFLGALALAFLFTIMRPSGETSAFPPQPHDPNAND
jgi:hypothetical protein